MDKTLKLFLKQFSHRTDEELDSLYECLKHQSFLKRFFPESLDYLRLFLKLCLIGFSYNSFLHNQIAYNSFESHNIFFLISGKASIFHLKKNSCCLDLQNFSPNQIITEETFNKIGMCKIQRTLEKGDSFGAYSKENDANTLILVIPYTHIEILSLEKTRYMELFLQNPDENPEKSLLFSKIFPELPPSERLALNFIAKEKKFERNSWVYREGDISNGNELYIIKKGELRIYKNFKQENNRKIICLSEIGAGEIIGFEGIFSNGTEIIRDSSLKVNSIEGLIAYEIDMRELNYLRKEFKILSQNIEKLANLKKNWLKNRVTLIEKSIFNKESRGKINSLSPDCKEKKLQRNNRMKENEETAFGITFIKRVLEKHFKAHEIMENRKIEVENQDAVNIEKKKRENKKKGTKIEKTNKLNEENHNKIKILPKIFEKFDKYVKDQRKKERTLEEFKAEISAQIKEQSWNFGEKSAVSLEKNKLYSPVLRTHPDKFRKSPSPSPNAKKEETKHTFIQTIPFKGRSFKRWKSPL